MRGVYIDPVLSRTEKTLNDYWKTATDYRDIDLRSGELIKAISKILMKSEIKKNKENAPDVLMKELNNEETG